jgi:hypothetical protein
VSNSVNNFDLWILGWMERVGVVDDLRFGAGLAWPDHADDVKAEGHVVKPTPMKKHASRPTDLPLLDDSDRLPWLSMIGVRSSLHFNEHPRRSLPRDEVDFADQFPSRMNDDAIPLSAQPFRRQPFASSAERRGPPIFQACDEPFEHGNPPDAVYFIEHVSKSARSDEWTGSRWCRAGCTSVR